MKLTINHMRIVTIILFTVLLAACSTTSTVPKSEAFEKFYEENPSTVLITAPINKIEGAEFADQAKFYFPIDISVENRGRSEIPINHSPKTKAAEYFYPSLATPFSNKGYSVFAPERTGEILKAENITDSASLLDDSLLNFGEKHGVDMVVFTLIHDWKHNWRQSTMDIKVEYIIKSAHTDEILYARKGQVKYDLAPNPRGRALASTEYNLNQESTVYSFNPSQERYLEVAKATNIYALNNLPYGTYHGRFETDGNKSAGKKEFKAYLNEYSEL